MRLISPDKLDSHIRKLARRIEQLQRYSNRFAALRLIIIVFAGVGTWAIASAFGSPWSWLTLIIFVALFSVVAYLHRHLDEWTEKFKLWRAIKIDQAARLRLEWELLPGPNFPSRVEERSALEIDLDLTGPMSLHHLLDIAISKQGGRLLANWLVQPEPDLSQVQRRQGLVRELAPMQRFRDRLRLIFRFHAKEMLDGEKLVGWLQEQVPFSRLKAVLPIVIVLSLSTTFLFILNSFGWLPPYWIISLSLYGVFYMYNIGAASEFLNAVVDLDRELSKFAPILHYLEASRISGYTHLAELCAPFLDKSNPPSHQLRQIKLITAAVGLRTNPVLSLLVNLVLPWDFTFAYLAARSRSAVAQRLPGWLHIFYELEALNSLANFAYLHPDYCTPEISAQAEPAFFAQELGHPLLPPQQKVCNDITVESPGQIAIITGSNMAGKSTFIKTVGINLCLAYAGGPANARQLRAVPLRLHTCIRIRDSLTDGYSYFYAEVRCLKSLLRKLREEDGLPVLYLVDEIFRGTNNRERLIGSRAYLRAAAGQNGIGILATHDLELANLAEQSQQVRNYHFRDQVQAGKLIFDYKIQPGPCPSSNALHIMQLEGLPVEEGHD